MSRWVIELIGERFDTEEYPSKFPEGTVFAFDKDGRVFMTGEGFESFSRAADVLEYAEQLIDLWHAALTLVQPNLLRPQLGGVTREHDDGGKEVHVSLREGLTARSKISATGVAVGGQPQRGPSRAQRMLDAAAKSTHLKRAMLLWSVPHRSWPQLYVILEEIEAHLGAKVNDVGYATKALRDRFTRTANSAEGAGLEARHGSGKYQPATDPMSLADGTDLIRQVLGCALEQT